MLIKYKFKYRLDQPERTQKHRKIIMIEPANSLQGRFIYQNVHYEPFDPQREWNFPQEGPMSAANGAFPWIVFERDRQIFEKKFPDFQIIKIKYHTPLRYLISGGLSFKQPVPDFSYGLFKFFDNFLIKISKQTAMFMTIKPSLKQFG